LREIELISEAEGFWDDHEAAQKLLKEKKMLDNKVQEFKGLETDIEDVEVLMELAQ